MLDASLKYERLNILFGHPLVFLVRANNLDLVLNCRASRMSPKLLASRLVS